MSDGGLALGAGDLEMEMSQTSGNGECHVYHAERSDAVPGYDS